LADEKKADDKKDVREDGKAPAVIPPKPPTPELVRIDFDGIANRIVDLPIPAADMSRLQAGAAGQIFFLRETDGKMALQRFDFKDRKTRPCCPK